MMKKVFIFEAAAILEIFNLNLSLNNFDYGGTLRCVIAYSRIIIALQVFVMISNVNVESKLKIQTYLVRRD